MNFQNLLLAAIESSEIPLRFEPGAAEAVAKPVIELLQKWISAHMPGVGGLGSSVTDGNRAIPGSAGVIPDLRLARTRL
jgi:hypothetical protein